MRLGDQRGGMKRHETTQTGGVQDSRNAGLDRMRRRGKGMNRKELQKEVLGTDRSNEERRGVEKEAALRDTVHQTATEPRL